MVCRSVAGALGSVHVACRGSRPAGRAGGGPGARRVAPGPGADRRLRAEAQARGIAPEPLRATLYGGQAVKTDKTGWYLRKNQSLAIGEDGAYYVLTVPGGLRERISGVRLKPSRRR